MESFEMPEDLSGGGNFLDQEGTYHVIVTEVKAGKDRQDKVIDGNTYTLSVLGGANAVGKATDQVGKTTQQTLRNPNLKHSDGGKFARKIVGSFYIATGLVDLSQLGKRVELNVEDTADRQFVVKLHKEPYTDSKTGQEKTALAISFSDIYHVDDPRVATVPKDTESIKLIPAALRRKPEYFEPILKAAAKEQESKGKDVDVDAL
jgi:hypothetical protein